MNPNDKEKYSLKIFKGEMLPAQKKFLVDAEMKAKDAYYPVSEKYEEGSWHSIDFFLVIVGMILIYLAIDKYLTSFITENHAAFINPIADAFLPAVVVGALSLLASLYMIIIKPVGQLIVTYQHQKP